MFGSVAYLNSATAVASGKVTKEDLVGALKSAGTAILVICAIFTLATGVMGCLVVKCKKRCFIICYGCSLGSTSLVIFVMGCVFASTASWMPATINLACTPKTNSTTWAYQKVSNMDTGMLDLNNQYMCTAKCPCDATAYNAGYANIPASNFTF